MTSVRPESVGSQTVEEDTTQTVLVALTRKINYNFFSFDAIPSPDPVDVGLSVSGDREGDGSGQILGLPITQETTCS